MNILVGWILLAIFSFSLFLGVGRGKSKKEKESKEKKKKEFWKKENEKNFAVEKIFWSLRPEVGNPNGRKLKMTIQDLGDFGGIIFIQRPDSQYPDLKIYLDYTQEGNEIQVQYGPEADRKTESYSLDELDYVKQKLAQEIRVLHNGLKEFTQNGQSAETPPAS